MDVNPYQSPKVGDPPQRAPFIVPLEVDYAVIAFAFLSVIALPLLALIGAFMQLAP